MEMKLHLIRGKRIIDQIDKLDESTYAELQRKTLAFTPPTEKRQWVVDPIQVQTIQYTPAPNSNTLVARGQINSNGTGYQSSIMFTDVNFQDENTPDNVTFTAADGKEYNIERINLAQSNVKVSCNCLDFYWRFSTWNHKDGSLIGTPPPPYQRKTDNRPPANEQKTPGVCKHLMKLVINIRDAGLAN